ncbi:MAG: hypothetical protein ACHQFX_03645 [Chitinophagales bacterium]
MMRKFLLFLIFLVVYADSISQNTIKSSTPCTDEVLFRTPGRWLKAYNGLLDYSESLRLTSAQKKEILNRLDTIHQMLLRIYPQPMALDAAWHHSISYGTFAEQVNYEPNSQGVLDRVALKEKPVASFNYTSGFFRHYCNPNNLNEISPGYPGGTNTWIYIYANTLEAKEYGADIGTIGGYPILFGQPQPLIKKMGDFELRGIVDKSERWVIIHREGMLPYIPVTRRQYLEHCIAYVEKFYDEGIKFLRESPLPFDDKDNREMRDAQIDKSIKNKGAALKLYRDELEKNTNDGTLELPAIVTGIFSAHLYDVPIFVSENEGWTLVTQNPDYMRQDLPKYVPQFFVVNWKWNEWKPQADIAKLIEERFPFDKLQAMIDK